MSEMQEEYEAQHKAEPSGLILSNKVYDALKFVAQILLPGVGALYFALAQIWGLPAAEEVVGTITAVDVFLGLFLGSSSKAYNRSDAKYDGFIDIDQDVINNKKTFTLELNSDPDDLEQKKDVTFKVNPAPVLD